MFMYIEINDKCTNNESEIFCLMFNQNLHKSWIDICLIYYKNGHFNYYYFWKAGNDQKYTCWKSGPRISHRELKFIGDIFDISALAHNFANVNFP